MTIEMGVRNCTSVEIFEIQKVANGMSRKKIKECKVVDSDTFFLVTGDCLEE